MSEKFRTKPKERLSKSIAPTHLSEHIARLAVPKMSRSIPEEEVVKVKKSAMKYKATKRIQNLAKPKRVNPKKTEASRVDPLTQSITSVSPSALNYKPTRRILELAQPKE
ncbi:uncharacterized protein LOC126743913 [Anthonomus grandis grandis]|uniref:uncharacterized protein LOC126743913 n=1 Tax=Anthonomus grandis grandis TaxID=2921223 RepID=UPI0021653222|nr:uncharacterized protein LOC126743913 [Anthonomus grandis grandis]